MGIYTIKPKFQKVLRPVEVALVRHKVHPTSINLFGLLCSLGAAVAIWQSPEYPWLLILVPILTTSRTACNALDGLVARGTGVADKFGEVLNEFIDRLSDSAIFLGLLLALPPENRLLATATLVSILLCSYLSILSKAAGGSRQYGGIMGKADRMIYISIAAIAVLIFDTQDIWIGFLWFTLFGTLITLTQRFVTTKQELRNVHK